jgi:hypothetical protein
MIGRLRQIAPGSMFLILGCLFLMFEGPVLYLEWRTGARAANINVRPGRVLLYVTSGFYGIYRAVALHPFYLEDYRKWLELTPWTIRKSLPLGPIELVWEDTIVLGVFLLIGLTQPEPLSVRMLCVFLIFHSLLLMATFWTTGVGTIGYLTAFGLGLAVRFWPVPWLCFAIASSVYLLVYEGLWQSLARFPWNVDWTWTSFRDTRLFAERTLGISCGWPYDRFLREIKSAERYHLDRTDAILLSLLIGWWTFCLESLITQPANRFGLPAMVPGVGLSVLASSRLAIYVSGYGSPIGLWGRVRTMRWIIPGYDQLFVGPLLTLLSVPAVLFPSRAAAVPLEIALPMCISAATLTALLSPPGLKVWRLTGEHRMWWTQQVQNAQSEYIKIG